MTQSLAIRKPAGFLNYAALRRKVEETLLQGQRKIEALKVQTYWETGRLLHEHILRYEERADYGDLTVKRLAHDLNVGYRLLWRTLQFYRHYPQIVSVRTLLGWSHYRVLATVDDDDKRTALEKAALKEKWNSRDLEIAIRDYHSAETAKESGPRLLSVPALGDFFTYRVIRPEIVHSKSNDLLVDLGFSATLELSAFGVRQFKDATIVKSVRDKKGAYSLEKAEGADETKLYTYKAFVERVIDGDTVKVEIDLGFKIRMRQTIRLKGLDCPEIGTPEGKAAKKFVEKQLEGSEFITVRTTRSDKYDRYLGDVFLSVKNSKSHSRNLQAGIQKVDISPTKNIGDDKASNVYYLNNLLLENLHAVRVSY